MNLVSLTFIYIYIYINDKLFKSQSIWGVYSYISLFHIFSHHTCSLIVARGMSYVRKWGSRFLTDLNCRVDWYLPLFKDLNGISTTKPIPWVSITWKGHIKGNIDYNSKFSLRVSIFFPFINPVFTIPNSLA